MARRALRLLIRGWHVGIRVLARHREPVQPPQQPPAGLRLLEALARVGRRQRPPQRRVRLARPPPDDLEAILDRGAGHDAGPDVGARVRAHTEFDEEARELPRGGRRLVVGRRHDQGEEVLDEGEGRGREEVPVEPRHEDDFRSLDVLGGEGALDERGYAVRGHLGGAVKLDGKVETGHGDQLETLKARMSGKVTR